MARSNIEDAPPIIIKKKKHGHDEPHGGAWKVAYADFVTAMMAFFLLLWLLNVTTEEQKAGISTYFQPTLSSTSTSGAGAILGGQSVAEDGAIGSPKQLVVIQQEQSGTATPRAGEVEGEGDFGGGFVDDGEGTEAGGTGAPGARTGTQAGAQGQQAGLGPDQQAGQGAGQGGQPALSAAARQEVDAFTEIEQNLRQALQGDPELRALQDSLVVDRAPEGLRIQLVDQEDYAMFPEASAILFERTAELISRVSRVLQQVPNEVSIAGHTSGVPFSPGSGYSNWELSTDRANATRRALVDAGLDEDRINNVVGKADNDLFVPENPSSPRNRRISITLLREAEVPPNIAGRPSNAF